MTLNRTSQILASAIIGGAIVFAIWLAIYIVVNVFFYGPNDEPMEGMWVTVSNLVLMAAIAAAITAYFKLGKLAALMPAFIMAFFVIPVSEAIIYFLGYRGEFDLSDWETYLFVPFAALVLSPFYYIGALASSVLVKRTSGQPTNKQIENPPPPPNFEE